MRIKWAMLVVLVCVTLAVVSSTGCGRPVEEQRLGERVQPAPEVNSNAVVWRTPEPPTNPQAGDVWADPRAGMELVYVPAGEFTLGSSDAELDAWLREYPRSGRSWFDSEQPQCRVNLPAYWIGRTEVTNAQYLRFVSATGHNTPEHWANGRPLAGLENFPIDNVSWEDARAYCEWAGGRLPRELEWEKAARGTDGRVFPWGNRWDRAKCCNCEGITWWSAFLAWLGGYDAVRGGPAAVGSYPSGGSPYGCQDMAGNVWERCEDWYDEQAYRRYARGDLTPPASGTHKVLRGGSWSVGGPQFFRCAERYVNFPGSRSYCGFRCVRGPE